MKKIHIIVSIMSFFVLATTIYSCKSSAIIDAQSGAQIWGANCVRCHNIASPETFSDTEWEVAATHMQIRANLTQEETRKVVEFLQAAN